MYKSIIPEVKPDRFGEIFQNKYTTLARKPLVLTKKNDFKMLSYSSKKYKAQYC